MSIGERLKELREAKGFSQGDVEKRTGLLRCYTSRVEHGYTVPTIDTLEKYARALEVPLYRFFYQGPPLRSLKSSVTKSKAEWGTNGKEREELRRFVKLLSQLDEHQRQILLVTALHMKQRKSKAQM